MASLNAVTIMGNLGRDPEMRTTGNGTAVCTLNIATTEYSKGADGEKAEKTEWHRVVVWSKQAENCGRYLKKGRTALVEGRLATREWTDKEGVKRYTTEIIANNVQFIGGAERSAEPAAVVDATATSDDIPF